MFTTIDEAPVTGTATSIAPPGHSGSPVRVSTRRCGESAGTNSPSVDSPADGPVNQPVTSMMTCPPLCEYTLRPPGEIGVMLDAARVWPDRSVLSSDASGRGVPAGKAVK